MAERPGTMIYFDILNIMDELTDEQTGQLFRGALLYARDGELPEFSDPMIRIAFAAMRDKMDRDSDKYSDRRLKNKWVRYCGIEKSAGRIPLPFEEWLEAVVCSDECEQSSTIVNECDQPETEPETETKTEPYTETESYTKAKTKTHLERESERKGVQGETQLFPPLDAYHPPDSSEWNRLKNEKVAKLREVLRE